MTFHVRQALREASLIPCCFSLASFYLFPEWISDPGVRKKRLIVSMQYSIDDSENGSLRSGLRGSCPILIQK